MATAPEHFGERRRSALIVDDSRVACAVLSRLLAREGFESELAASAYEAVERAREHRPDVIFMDHRMPGMTGLEAVRALKADVRTAKIPVVMFSSREDEAFLQAAREAGALAVLTKHTERTNLGPVLAQVRDALGSPARAAPPAAMAKPAPALHRATARVVNGLTRADLHAEIEPMLDAQHDRIHTELLAESAMLEQHQDRMLRTLTGRLQVLLGRTVRELTKQLTTRLDSPPPAPQPSLRWRLARGGLVAAVLALLAIPVALVVEQAQQLERLVASSAELRAALDRQSRAVGMLGLQVEDLERQVADSADGLQQATDVLREQQAAAPSMLMDRAEAVPLATLLAAAGVAGPVELRTTQGSFCLEIQANSYRLAPMAQAGGACEPGGTSTVIAGVVPAVNRGY